MSKRPTLYDVAEMIRANKRPLWEQDQAFWAFDRGVDFPLTHYDLETWEQACREGAPAARLVSNAGALTRYIEETWQKTRIDMRLEKGMAKIDVVIQDMEIGASSSFTGKLPLSELNRGLAIAFAGAHEAALSLQQRLYAVRGLAESVPPIQNWPIEEFSPGRFHSVLHTHQLASASWKDREAAARNVGSNHKGDYGMLLCRERYLKIFPAREIKDDTPSP